MSNQATQRAVLNVVRDTIARSDVPADPNAALPIAQAVAPIIAHATNSEPWYQSRVTWGVIVAAVATMVKPLTGELFDAAQTQDIVNALTSAGQLFGFGLTLYGRYIAKKPIGQ